MVHISDGVLSPQIIVAGWAITAVLLAFSFWWSGRKRDIAEEMPRLSLMTAAFFVASLVHIPVGPTCVHLILNGVVGITLGVLAFPAIFIGLVLQAFLFQHGGITAIGVNTVDMGVPALIAYVIFKLSERRKSLVPIIGGISGGIAVALAALLTSIVLIMSDYAKYYNAAIALLGAHIPLIAIEAVIAGSISLFLMQVKPEMLATMRDVEAPAGE